jgi:hypothetical protein
MSFSTKFTRYFRRWRHGNAQRKHAPRLCQYPAEIDWPQLAPHIPCRPEVITWNRYLSDEIREALLEFYPIDHTDEGVKAATDFLNSRSLKERIRIDHFDWTFCSYTVPDWPTYCVWLSREEIRDRIFFSPVPPFMAIEYDRIQKAGLSNDDDPSKVRHILFEDECMLAISQLFWKAEHYAVFQFYKTLPYNPQEQERNGRFLQRHY